MICVGCCEDRSMLKLLKHWMLIYWNRLSCRAPGFDLVELFSDWCFGLCVSRVNVETCVYSALVCWTASHPPTQTRPLMSQEVRSQSQEKHMRCRVCTQFDLPRHTGDCHQYCVGLYREHACDMLDVWMCSTFQLVRKFGADDTVFFADLWA